MNIRGVISANAKKGGIIEVCVHKEFTPKIYKTFKIYKNQKFLKDLKFVSLSDSRSSRIYTLLFEGEEYTPGIEYSIVMEDNIYIPLDLSYLAKTREFEEKYRYDGELGAIYTKKKTTFRVFSPFGSMMILRIWRRGSDHIEAYEMQHDLSNGVFSLEISGDLEGAKYVYEVRIFGLTYEVNDPYAFALDSNSRHAYVIDLSKIKKIPLHEDKLPPISDRTEAILYECHVRDMTSKTCVPNKGTYEALTTEGYKTEDGLPIGIDYLSSLGVTHIQLMPVLDYQTINDNMPFESYNWGYDPYYFFAPEGSLSKDPEDPYQRVIELRNLISKLHEKGLRAVLDVVYNHTFSVDFNPLNILVPDYYYRFNDDGTYSNGSGCGNDIETRHYMARKLVIDSLVYALEVYGVDGFRFDLMGILDIETMRSAYDALCAKKKDFLFYGEGWDLWTALPFDQKASYFNSQKMPYLAFFNDRFRDVAKGKTNESELSVSGYLLGDTNYRDGFKHVVKGSAVTQSFTPLFSHYSQSVNYVECHDNNTLYDKIKIARPDDSEAEIDRRIKMIDIAVLFSAGIPFFHAGQEIGMSKEGHPNTYNAGDRLNGFDYDLLNQKKELYAFFKDACALKKKFIEAAGDSYLRLQEKIDFEDLQNGALRVNYHFGKTEYCIIFNPSKESFLYSFNEDAALIFTDAGNVENAHFNIKMAIVSALSVSIYALKRADTKIQ